MLLLLHSSIWSYGRIWAPHGFAVSMASARFGNFTLSIEIATAPPIVKGPQFVNLDELRKQSSCSMQLTNKTDQYIAFKVKTTSPKRYCVRPNAGVVLPNSVCNVTVTMQAHKEAPADMQCKDKFLIQNVVAPRGTTNKDLTVEMFHRKDDKIVNEFKLRVVYIPANPPSPVPEGDEEGSPRTSSVEDDNRRSSLPEAVTRWLDKSHVKLSSSEARSMISKVTEEKDSAIQQNKKLQEELELLKRRTDKTRAGGSASMFVVLVSLLLGILVGYFIHRT